MKTKVSIFLLIIIFIACAYKSSPYKFSCNGEEHRKLGEIDFVTDFKITNIENDEQTLTFVNSEDELVFKKIGRRHPVDLETLRYRAYAICEKIIQGKSPVTKYAYYEYENLENSFVTEGGQIIIQPLILNHDKRLESLYINFSIHSIGYLHGRVPLYNTAENSEYINTNKLFKHHDSIQLNNDIELNDIWVFKQLFPKGELGVYYSKKLGIVALQADKKKFLRK